MNFRMDRGRKRHTGETHGQKWCAAMCSQIASLLFPSYSLSLSLARSFARSLALIQSLSLTLLSLSVNQSLTPSLPPSLTLTLALSRRSDILPPSLPSQRTCRFPSRSQPFLSLVAPTSFLRPSPRRAHGALPSASRAARACQVRVGADGACLAGRGSCGAGSKRGGGK